MSFLWPDALWLSLAIPALVGAYVAILRRRHRRAVRYASLMPVRAGMTRVHRLRRHVPALLFLTAIAVIVVASARPALVAAPTLPQRTLMVVIDASISMKADDVAPSRLAVAQAIAKTIVGWQPGDVRVGVIAFSHHAELLQAPTTDHNDAIAAIDAINLRFGSGVGTGLMGALIVLFPDDRIGAAYDIFAFRAPEGYFDALDAEQNHPARRPRGGVAPGSSATQSVVLLTDGYETGGVPMLWAARAAADHGVRVFAVGVGTPRGAVVEVMHTEQHMLFDGAPLKSVADLTRGKYFHAGTAASVEDAYRGLRAWVAFESRDREITAMFVAPAVLLLLASAGLSLLWFNRLE